MTNAGGCATGRGMSNKQPARRRYFTADGKPKKKQGAFSKRLDPAMTQVLIQALSAGSPIAVACGYANIEPASFYGWMRQGKVAPEGTLAREFFNKVQRAKAEFVLRSLAVIQKAANAKEKPNWQAAAWMLERRYPDLFARRYTPAGAPARDEYGDNLDDSHLSAVDDDAENEDLAALTAIIARDQKVRGSKSGTR